MKSTPLFIVLLLIFSQNIFADQLAWITKKQAISAVDIINGQNELLLFCGCCDSDPKVYLQNIKCRMQYAGSNDYFEVLVTGHNKEGQQQEHAVDLAYVFVNVEGVAKCLGKELTLECDPCTGTFAWESPFKAPVEEFPVTVETLVFKAADAMGQQAWLLTFSSVSNPDDDHLFVISWENVEKLGVGFVDWSNVSYGVANEKLIGKKFKISSYTTEVENEFTGESEIQSILTKAEPVSDAPANKSKQDGSSEGDDKANMVDIKEVKRYVDNVRSSYLISGLDEVNRTISNSQKIKGLVDINKFIPAQDSLPTELTKMEIGKDECDDEIIFCTLYDDNLVVENGVTTHYFFVEDMKNKFFRLTKGMTKQEVIAVLGSPYTQRSNVFVYLTSDNVEDHFSNESNAKHYYGGVRIIFEKGKLHAVWVVAKAIC